jgi:hypothetical protein
VRKKKRGGRWEKGASERALGGPDTRYARAPRRAALQKSDPPSQTLTAIQTKPLVASQRHTELPVPVFVDPPPHAAQGGAPLPGAVLL